MAEGEIKAVYRIDDWERASDGRRWGFNGARDLEMEKKYLGADVRSLFPPGAANPITYLNC